MPVPQKPSERDAAVERIARTFNKETAIFDPDYEEIERGYNLLIGDHYTETQKSYYKSHRRPTNVWNLVFPMINRIFGEYLMSQHSIRIYSKRAGSPEMAGLLTDVCENIATNTDYKNEMGATVLAALIKRGFAYPHLSTRYDLDGSVRIVNVDEFEIIFDSRAQDYFLRDAQYLIRSRWMTVPQILAKWPNHRSKLKDILKDRETSVYWEGLSDYQQVMAEHRNFFMEKDGKYRVIEFHDREYDRTAEVAYDAETNDAELVTLEGKRREAFFRLNPQLKRIEISDAEMVAVTECIPALNFFLDKYDCEIQDGYFDYTPCYAYSYGKKAIKHFGIMKNADGPSMEFNDQRNRMLDIVNKAANTAIAAKPGKILNYSHVKEHSDEPGLIVEVDENADIDDVYKRFDPPKNPYANQQLTDTSYNLLNRIIGITENLRGETQTAQENASLFAYRVREAEKSFVPMERGIRRTENRVWSRVIKLIQHHYTAERFMTITTPGLPDRTIGLNVRLGEEILNDVRVGEYAVLASMEERNPTARALLFIETTELVRMIAELWGPQAVYVRGWLQYAPIEEVEKFMQQIEQVQQAQQQQLDHQEAVQSANDIMGLAGQRLALEDGGVKSQGPAEGG